ncbi:hypothetical protein BRD17_09880 [Halobacteriales archaeon SW_7_68_16]|nr:MAG: hypothetical protein BRD17_09880 [Halobacteriales archaeon SW_7_68_16]
MSEERQDVEESEPVDIDEEDVLDVLKYHPHPMITVKDVMMGTGTNRSQAYRLLESLTDEGVLRRRKLNQRNLYYRRGLDSDG